MQRRMSRLAGFLRAFFLLPPSFLSLALLPRDKKKREENKMEFFSQLAFDRIIPVRAGEKLRLKIG